MEQSGNPFGIKLIGYQGNRIQHQNMAGQHIYAEGDDPLSESGNYFVLWCYCSLQIFDTKEIRGAINVHQ